MWQLSNQRCGKEFSNKMKIVALKSVSQIIDCNKIFTISIASSSTSWKYIPCVLGKYQEGNDAVKVGKAAAKFLVVASYLPQHKKGKSSHTIKSLRFMFSKFINFNEKFGIQLLTFSIM